MMESPTTPGGKSRKNSFCSRSNKKDSKNPYSTRGLDKFSALVAELEEKRQKILSEKGSENVSFVRFVYKDTDDCVPVVVKVKKEKKQEKTKCDDPNKDKTTNHNGYSEITDKFPLYDADQKGDRLRRSESDKKITKKMKFSWNILRQPSYYLPVAVILILVLLAFFGRSFVIICTSIGWYIIPTIRGSGSSSNVRRSMKKKDYVRRTSDKKIVIDPGLSLSSPKTSKSLNNSGNLKDESPRKHSHRRSW